jgi:hypothetical protein
MRRERDHRTTVEENGDDREHVANQHRSSVGISATSDLDRHHKL